MIKIIWAKKEHFDMTKLIYKISVFLLLSLPFSALATEIHMDGIFQGKNLYVVNPFASSGVGFCVYEVSVNGQITTDEINSSAFEIDLSMFQLKLGDKLKVTIKHKENCKPKVLNPEVLKPKSTFETIFIEVKDSKLNWSTKNEAGELTFFVEQFRWNKWVKVGEVEGKGTEGPNSYSYKVTPHSGDNKFRVKQVDYTKKSRYSTEATFKDMLLQVVTMESKRVSDQLVFSAETMYEIWDNYGNILLKGSSKEVDVSKLDKGKYWVMFDNTMDQFVKK